MDKRFLQQDEVDKIIDLYVNQNYSIQRIKRETGHCSKSISKTLHNNGIDVKLGLRKFKPTKEQNDKIIDLINKRYSYKEISDIIGVDTSIIRRIAEENNLHSRYLKVNRNIKDDFFSVIDSEEKAWLLGFLFTDGSVRHKGHEYHIRLSVQSGDMEIIEKIKEMLGLDCAICLDKRDNKECVYINFSSKQMFDDLSNYGIVPNKTYITDSLYLDKIPEEFRRDYLRGIFDGDGILSFTGNIWNTMCGFVSHFRSTVKQFQKAIDDGIGKQEHTMIKDSVGKSQCSWRGRRQTLKVLSYLYDGSNVYLKRKYDKYMWIKNTKLKYNAYNV